MIANFTINTHLGRLHELITKLKRYREATSQQQFFDDETRQDAILHNLHLAAEAVITIAEMLIAERGYHKPEEPRGLFTVLAKEGVLDPTFAESVAGLVNFRNILVHDYLTVDPAKAFDVLSKHLDDLDTFAQAIARTLTDHPLR